MMTRTKFAALLFASCLAGTLGLIGCGDDLGSRYPVSGKVTYNGKPLEKGLINFMPVKPEGRGATGPIIDGYYKLTTQVENDGAFPAEYNVIITAVEVDEAQIEAETKKNAEKAKVQATTPDQAAVGHALKAAKSAIPAKYGQIATSGMKATVEAKSNTFDWTLTD